MFKMFTISLLLSICAMFAIMITSEYNDNFDVNATLKDAVKVDIALNVTARGKKPTAHDMNIAIRHAASKFNSIDIILDRMNFAKDVESQLISMGFKDITIGYDLKFKPGDHDRLAQYLKS